MASTSSTSVSSIPSPPSPPEPIKRCGAQHDVGGDSILVLDYGSLWSRLGVANDDEPTHTIQTVIGRPKRSLPILTDEKGVSSSMNGTRFGDDALSAPRALYQMKYPIEGGSVVTNWDDMERAYQHSFDVLRVQPSEHPVGVCTIPLSLIIIHMGHCCGCSSIIHR
jgi:actin-related protein